MADIPKIKRNIQRMIDADAPEEDIDAYLSGEGVTPEQLRQPQGSPRPQSTGSWKEDPVTAKDKAVDVAKRMGRTAYNVGPDTVEAAQGLAGFIAHPIKSLGAVGEAIGGAAYDVTHMSDEQKAALKQKAIGAAKDPIGTFNTVADKAATLVEQHPVDAALMVVSPKTPKVVGDAAKAVTRTITDIANPSDALLANKLKKIVVYNTQKGIRPSVVGKNNAGRVAKYYDDTTTAVSEIVSRNPQAKPTNLAEYSEAISTTKKAIYDEYHSMAVNAGSSGAMVDLAPIRAELQNIADAPNIRGAIKNSANEVLSEIKSYDDIITPSVAEDLIASFNADTRSWWKNPNPNGARTAVMLERTNQALRKSLDDAIDQYRGPGYQDLKKKHGALSSIEKDVAHRSMIDARKNVKGFFDLADIASTSEFVYGLATMNPAVIAKAATIHGAKKVIQKLNDPNRYIKNMFQQADKIIQKQDKITSKTKPPTKTPPPATTESSIPSNPNGELVSGRLSLQESHGGPLGSIIEPSGARLSPFNPASNPNEYFGNPATPYTPPSYPPSIEPDFIGNDSILTSLIRRKRTL